MIVMSYVCDYCGKPLRTCKKIVFGVEVEVVETATTKELDTRTILPHLHKECATEIDYTMLKEKLRLMEELSANNPKIRKIHERTNIS